MSHYCDTQLQVTENVGDLCKLSPNLYQCFNIEGTFLLLSTGYTGAYKKTERLL